jgi:hypothetical protein
MYRNLKQARHRTWLLLSLFIGIILIGLLIATPVGFMGITYWFTGTQITMDGQNPPTFTLSGESPVSLIVAEVEPAGSPERKEETAQRTYWEVYFPPRQITYGGPGKPLGAQPNHPLPLVEGKTYRASSTANHSSAGFTFIIKDGKAVEVKRD